MKRDEFRSRWVTRSKELESLGALVDGAKLCQEFLRDLESVWRDESESPLTLKDAAQVSGYSRDHIARMIRDGRLENVGRKHSPRVRVGDLPRKNSSLREPAETRNIVSTSKRQIARAVVTSRNGRHDD